MASSEENVNPTPLSSHLLGKYFAWRGRKSTGFCYSIMSPNDQPWRPVKNKDGDTDGSQSDESERDDYGNDNFSVFMRAYSDNVNKHRNDPENRSPPPEPEDCVIGSTRELHSGKPRHFKVHGKDAYENALKSLGNVDTLFNRYGYDEKAKTDH